MFHQQDYDLSRQKYVEYNTQYERLYVPIWMEKPSFVRRLMVALRGSEQISQSAGRGESREARAGVVAK